MKSNLCLLPLFIPLIFIACQKERYSSAEWRELAQGKWNEIQVLTSSIPCNQENETSIEEIKLDCYTSFLPVTPAIAAEFGRLRDEYLSLRAKEREAAIKEGVIIEPCDYLWITPDPIRLGCADNRIQVYTVENIPLDEGEALAAELYTEIMHYTDTVRCVDAVNWHYTGLINYASEARELIPVHYGAASVDLVPILSSYQVLSLRILEAKGFTELAQPSQLPSGIACENGKPVFQYAD